MLRTAILQVEGDYIMTPVAESTWGVIKAFYRQAEDPRGRAWPTEVSRVRDKGLRTAGAFVHEDLLPRGCCGLHQSPREA